MDDRRKYFRLLANLPLDVILPADRGKTLRRVSSNVSAGGVYFHSHSGDDVCPGQKIEIRIAVPAGAGRMSGAGVLEGGATVIRVDTISHASKETAGVGVACAFNEPLRFGEEKVVSRQ
ncbi:MAG: PilZ domain-containing protein [Phycisphaerae bacterium]